MLFSYELSHFQIEESSLYAIPLRICDFFLAVKWHVEVDTNQDSLILQVHIFNAELRAERHLGQLRIVCLLAYHTVSHVD